jgi:hypothetical protein
MPKIRDLGINVIPETMRPPEIGGGGGKAGGGGKDGGGCEGATAKCGEGTARDYRDCPSGTFQDSVGCKDYGECTSGTFQGTGGCKDYDRDCTSGTFVTTTGCYGAWATPDLTRIAAAQTGKPEAAAFTREAIELLKQQLHQQIEKLEEIARNLTNDEK